MVASWVRRNFEVRVAIKELGPMSGDRTSATCGRGLHRWR
jgi:hypothetical protein